MGTIITLDQAMSSPLANTPTIGSLGQVITSDTFNRDGALFQSMTDVFRGGVPKQWLGTNGTGTGGTAASTSANTGLMSFGPKAVTSLCVDAGTPDVSFAVKLASVGATAAGLNQMIDVRKSSADTGDCYRVALFAGSVSGFTMRLYKRVSGTGTQLSGVDVSGLVGQT